MIIKYTFATNEETEVEVSEEIGTVILESRRKESNGDRKERAHCWSLDAIAYEGDEYGIPDYTEAMFDGSDERAIRIREAFSHLTDTQQRRMLMLASGLSEREIARREGVAVRAVEESIAYARKKFFKYF